MTSNPNCTIVVSAVVMRDEAGNVLHVRKRGTNMLMLPGGKPDAGEQYAETAIREFREELGGALVPEQLSFLGTFTADAANEAGYTVEGHVFTHPLVPFDGPHAEIEHLEWVDPPHASAHIAPMSIKVMRALHEVAR